jgi:hypothetical protein
VKPDASQYKEITDETQWVRWDRELVVLARAHGVSKVLSAPESDPEYQNWYNQWSFMFMVFQLKIKFPAGKTIVQKHHRTGDAQAVYDSQKIHDFQEALWHFEMMVLHISLNDKQYQLLGRLNEAVMGRLQQQSGTFFKMTHIPTYKEQHRIYGKTDKQSLWNNLPIPPVECMGGVVYISLEHMVKFMFAHGIGVDNIFV